ncbi:MAG TPA: succinylglutamate desuccinylase/aspartoacylase family protein [Stellaceae bacterium]|nr:succinylglutamate desuccinylase/aspartoacylase family protein [Stellaceae bacterium]
MPSYRLELLPPDIGRYRAGNRGIDYVTTLESGTPGPHVLINALTHGNELCGAVALDHLFKSGLKPAKGRITLVFANVAAFRTFDPDNPGAARYLDEDFNRLWDKATLEGPRRSSELDRARRLKPIYESADKLLDLHSMQHATAPLMLIGLAAKTEAFARQVGVPALMVRDKGHDAGPRLRDYAAFAAPEAPQVALLAECGQHWEKAAADVAIDSCWRFLAVSGVLEPARAAEIVARTPPPPKLISVTETVTIGTDDFRFTADYRGLEVIPKAGSLIARDGKTEIRTPYDECVLIMPSRRLGRGQTAVRLGRYSG